jgi:hypothetical protein
MEIAKIPVAPLFVIASPFVIADFSVIPDSIRDPVPRHHWIADQVRNDKGRVQDDNGIYIFSNSLST